MGAELLVQSMPDYVAGKLIPRPQPAEGVSHAPKIKKQDGHIDWNQPAHAIWNRVRGLVPWPGAFTFLPGQPHPHLLKLWQAGIVDRSGPSGEVLQADNTGIVVGCGCEALRILILQREGGRRMQAHEVLAGHPLLPGQRLG
jgi:methionyl-tRNA formyltransferase